MPLLYHEPDRESFSRNARIWIQIGKLREIGSDYVFKTIVWGTLDTFIDRTGDHQTLWISDDPVYISRNPEMERQEAFLISKRMMMGQKMNAFVLDLTFIGWRILEMLSFGIVGIFYSGPYYELRSPNYTVWTARWHIRMDISVK